MNFNLEMQNNLNDEMKQNEKLKGGNLRQIVYKQNLAQAKKFEPPVDPSEVLPTIGNLNVNDMTINEVLSRLLNEIINSSYDNQDTYALDINNLWNKLSMLLKTNKNKNVYNDVVIQLQKILPNLIEDINEMNLDSKEDYYSYSFLSLLIKKITDGKITVNQPNEINEIYKELTEDGKIVKKKMDDENKVDKLEEKKKQKKIIKLEKEKTKFFEEVKKGIKKLDQFENKLAKSTSKAVKTEIQKQIKEIKKKMNLNYKKIDKNNELQNELQLELQKSEDSGESDPSILTNLSREESNFDEPIQNEARKSLASEFSTNAINSALSRRGNETANEARKNDEKNYNELIKEQKTLYELDEEYNKLVDEYNKLQKSLSVILIQPFTNSNRSELENKIKKVKSELDELIKKKDLQTIKVKQLQDKIEPPATGSAAKDGNRVNVILKGQQDNIMNKLREIKGSGFGRAKELKKTKKQKQEFMRTDLENDFNDEENWMYSNPYPKKPTN